MSRSAGLLVLAACVTVLVGAFLATASSIALGAWSPLGERPPATPTPGAGGPIGGPPDMPTSYEEFLADVQAGNVEHVDFVDGAVLMVATSRGDYQIAVPEDIPDPEPDIFNAATLGNVPPPTITIEGGQRDLGERSYADMLADVEAGLLFDVSHSGTRLDCSGRQGYYHVILDGHGPDVLADIEAAAAAGGVSAPFYSKSPGD